MKFFKVLAVVPFVFAIGCATSPPTPAERMAAVGLSFPEAEKQLAQAEKDLASFEKSVASLRETAANSKNMRTKAAYDETLARLDGRLQETRFDLTSLKETNRRAGEEYKRQLEAAATQMQISSDSNQAP